MVDRRSVQPRRSVGYAIHRTASCCGPGSRRNRCRSDPDATRRRASRSLYGALRNRDGPVDAAHRAERRGARLKRPSRIRCTSRSPACRRDDRIGIASRAVTRQSRIGKATTLPGPDADLAKLTLGFVSCANYEHGYFAAYRHLADESPDLAIFLGDYIYEYIDKSRDEGSRAQRRRRSDDVAAVSQPLCAVSDGPGPAAAARRSAVHHDVGRPRSAERLRRRMGADLRRSGAYS